MTQRTLKALKQFFTTHKDNLEEMGIDGWIIDAISDGEHYHEKKIEDGLFDGTLMVNGNGNIVKRPEYMGSGE